MAEKISIDSYVPGTYARRKPGAETMVGHYVRAWEQRGEAARQVKAASSEIAPCIAFSRKIGVGALEIADILGAKLECPVADRTIIEQIANQANTSEAAIGFFDERFPGYTNRTFKYLFGEKSFIDSDYSRHLISAVFAIAGLEPTIFVGRGAHLILPRARVLAVRCIGSDDYRVKRLADILGVGMATAREKLAVIDKEQAAFFKKVFGKKAASPYEFDLVVNLDHFVNPEDAADIVALAFERKFRSMH